jgi:EmrB/QacA subfamily drug resistance transporter
MHVHAMGRASFADDRSTIELSPLHSSTGIAVMAATVLASVVAALGASVIRVAVPAIGRDFNAGVAALQWTVTGYLLTTAALLLLAGALADRFGRKRILVGGLLIALVGSMLCSIAPSVETLIVARLIQGVGGALITPTSLALLNGTLRNGDRAGAIGLWVGIETLLTSFGPYVGGWFVDQVSWRAIFLINVPLVVICLAILLRVPESGNRQRSLSLDFTGALLAVLGLGGVVYALTAGPTSGWSSGPVLAGAIVGLGALGALLPAQRRVPDPMLKLTLFASRQFSAINLTTLLLYGALGAAGYLVSLQLQLRLGYSAAEAGAALIPTTVMLLVTAPISGVLVSRIGPRWPMVVGILALAAAFVWMSALQPGASYLESVLPPAVLWGVGIGIAVTPLTAAVLGAVNDADLGEASAINDAAARVGSVVVIALIPVLISAGSGSLADALVGGYRPAMIAMAGLAGVSALVAAAFVSDQRATAHAANPVSEPATA